MGTLRSMRTVEVFADVLCPFTHAGLHTLIDRRAERGVSEPRLRIRAWPLEMVNGAPLDPQHIAAEITALRHSVRPDLFAGYLRGKRNVRDMRTTLERIKKVVEEQ